MKKETLTVETDEDGTVTYRNASDQLHNANGPAMVCADGSKAYFINGKLHHPNGPAVVHADGDKSHFINGDMYRDAWHKAWQSKQSAPCSICTWCDEPIEADHPSVPDVNGDAGDRQHIGCAVEEADEIGFDGFMQDQG